MAPECDETLEEVHTVVREEDEIMAVFAEWDGFVVVNVGSGEDMVAADVGGRMLGGYAVELSHCFREPGSPVPYPYELVDTYLAGGLDSVVMLEFGMPFASVVWAVSSC